MAVSRRGAAFGLLALTLSATGCSNPPPPAAVAEPPPPPSPPPPPPPPPPPLPVGDAVLLDDSADGTAVHLHPGQKLILKLPENSSTGFRWKVVSGIGRSLVQSDRSYQSDAPPPAPGKPHRVGVPGTAVFTFVAKHHGKTRLQLALLPPGGHRKPAKFFSLAIDISRP